MTFLLPINDLARALPPLPAGELLDDLQQICLQGEQAADILVGWGFEDYGDLLTTLAVEDGDELLARLALGRLVGSLAVPIGDWREGLPKGVAAKVAELRATPAPLPIPMRGYLRSAVTFAKTTAAGWFISRYSRQGESLEGNS